MNKSILVAAAFIFSAIVMPASATITEEITNKHVQFADLNLSNPAGQATLYKRLKNAAKNACAVNSHHQTKSLSGLMEGKSCYKETLSSAVEQVNNNGLTKLHMSS